MAVTAVIPAGFGLFVAGVAAWYAMWHRRPTATAFQRVSVGADRSTLVVHRGGERSEDTASPPFPPHNSSRHASRHR